MNLWIKIAEYKYFVLYQNTKTGVKESFLRADLRYSKKLKEKLKKDLGGKKMSLERKIKRKKSIQPMERKHERCSRQI